VIDVKNLPDYLFSNKNAYSKDVVPINGTLKDTMDYYEREYILELLRFCEGNVTKASSIALIARQNLHAKMKAYGIDVTKFRKRDN